MPVNTARADYLDMTTRWARLRDCCDGRDAILKAGNKYVPDLPGTDAAGNKAYRERGNFYNAVMRTVQGMNGAIFQKAPEVLFPETYKEYLDDVTLTNVPFEMFAVDAGREIMLVGRYGILIDFPAREQAVTKRPYLVGYVTEDIINWRTTRQDGDEALSFVVLRERVEQPNTKDPFINDSITQYRVVELKNGVCVQQLYRELQLGSGVFLPYELEMTLQRRGVALDFVPFVFIGATHASPELERPPLLDLADVNLGHWRNSVDHEHGLHLVALPTPWVSGNKAAGGAPMKIGPSVVWELDVQGSAGMLEFAGTGLASLVTAMDDKKKQMASIGARLLEDATSAETATAVMMRHAGETASLKTVAGSLEIGFTMALQIMAWWAGTDDVPHSVDADVELNKEYLNVKASGSDIQVALTALQAGEISFETWWNIITTGGWGREGVDAEAEREQISKEEAMVEPDDTELPDPAAGGEPPTIDPATGLPMKGVMPAQLKPMADKMRMAADPNAGAV
jgi:hypothetical protein